MYSKAEEGNHWGSRGVVAPAIIRDRLYAYTYDMKLICYGQPTKTDRTGLPRPAKEGR